MSEVKEVKGIDVKAITNKANNVIRKVLNIDEELDLTTLSNEQLYNLFKPAIDAGALIGYVGSTKVATTDNNGETNTLNCGVMIPSVGQSVFADGSTNFIRRTVRFTLSGKAKVNDIICINPAAWAVRTSSYVFEEIDKESGEVKAKNVRSIHATHKSRILDDNKKLIPSYDWVTNHEDKRVGLNLQGHSVSMYKFVEVAEEA